MYKLRVKFYNRPLHLPLNAKVCSDNIVEFTLPPNCDLQKFQDLVCSWDSSNKKPHIEVIKYG
jgi:hypothetical protein